jgi:hypothetical protein
MTLTLDELARRFPCLTAQLRLLAADPAEPGDCVGAGDFQARARWRDQRDAALLADTPTGDMLDLLARDGDGDLAQMIVSAINNLADS